VEHENNKVEQGASVKKEDKFAENDSDERENVAETKPEEEEETQSSPEPESSVLAAGAKLRPDAPEFIPSPPLSPAAPTFVPRRRAPFLRNDQMKTEVFSWPRQSARIQNLKDGAQQASDLDDSIVKRLQELGIYRNEEVDTNETSTKAEDGEEKPTNVVDAARKSGKNAPRNKIRMLFDTFCLVPREGLEKTEQIEDVPKIVCYIKKSKKDKSKEKENKENKENKEKGKEKDINSDWRLAGKKSPLTNVIRKDSLSLPTAIRSN